MLLRIDSKQFNSICFRHLKDGVLFLFIRVYSCLCPVLNTFYEFNLAFDLAAYDSRIKIRFGVIRFGLVVDKIKC